jgi:hypothetical protein
MTKWERSRKCGSFFRLSMVSGGPTVVLNWGPTRPGTDRNTKRANFGGWNNLPGNRGLGC